MTFTTKDVNAEFVAQLAAKVPEGLGYYERERAFQELLKEWRSEDGLSLKEMCDEVAKVKKKFDRQAGELVEAIRDSVFEGGADASVWKRCAYTYDIADAVIQAYGYDSYEDGNWINSDY